MLFVESGDAGEWGAASRWLADVVRGVLGASGRGHDGAGVRLQGKTNGWGWRRVSYRCELARRAGGRPMEFIRIGRALDFPYIYCTELKTWLGCIL